MTGQRQSDMNLNEISMSIVYDVKHLIWFGFVWSLHRQIGCFISKTHTRKHLFTKNIQHVQTKTHNMFKIKHLPLKNTPECFKSVSPPKTLKNVYFKTLNVFLKKHYSV